MTAKDIQIQLDRKYINSVKYVIHNIYCFGGYNEIDTLVISKSGYLTDFEVKISRTDFKNDFKKLKHTMLGKDYYPNKFYFIVPENLVKIEEIPHYAGLMYVTDAGIKEIKKAPFLHKSKINFKEKILSKMYWAYRDLLQLKERDGVEKLKKEISGFNKIIDEKNKEIWLHKQRYNELNSEFRHYKNDGKPTN